MTFRNLSVLVVVMLALGLSGALTARAQAAEAGGAAPGGTATGGGKVVFADHFQNGRPTDSDSTPGFWHIAPPAAAHIREADGRLTITADGPAKIVSVGMRSQVSPDFNFFKHRLTFHVAVQMTGTAPPQSQSLRFALTSQPGAMNFVSPDAVAVRYDGLRNVYLYWKENAPNKTPEDPVVGHRLVVVKLAQPLTGFDLTLGPTDYKLVVHDGGQSQTFSGAHGIDPAQWGADSKGITTPTHNSAIDLETLRINAPDPSTRTESIWKSIVVTEGK